MNKVEKIVADTQADVERIYSTGENLEQGLQEAHKALSQQSAVENAANDETINSGPVPVQKQQLPIADKIESNFAAVAKASAKAVDEHARDQPFNGQSAALVQTLRDERALINRRISDVEFHCRRLIDEHKDYKRTLAGIDAGLEELRR